MKFLYDVHISYGFVAHLKSIGLEATHVNKILDGYNTADRDICIYADNSDFVVVTKDIDFKTSFLLSKTPRKLIKINLGNLSNASLIKTFSDHLITILQFKDYSSFLLEMDQDSLIISKPHPD